MEQDQRYEEDVQEAGTADYRKHIARSFLPIIILGDVFCLWLHHHCDLAAAYCPGVGLLAEAQTLAVTAAAMALSTVLCYQILKRSGDSSIATFGVSYVSILGAASACYLPYLACSDYFIPVLTAAVALGAVLCLLATLEDPLIRNGLPVERCAERALIVFFVALCTCSISSGVLFGSKTHLTPFYTTFPPILAELDDAGLANTRDIVESVWSEGFVDLSPEDKAEVLAVAAQTEARYLGLLGDDLSATPAVVIVQDSAPAMAHYNYRENTVQISISCLYLTPDLMFQSLCHELAHAFQYRYAYADGQERDALAERTGYPFALSDEKGDEWREEFEGYSDDPAVYYSQSIEQEAYRYGVSSTLQFKDELGLPMSVDLWMPQVEAFQAAQ